MEERRGGATTSRTDFLSSPRACSACCRSSLIGPTARTSRSSLSAADLRVARTTRKRAEPKARRTLSNKVRVALKEVRETQYWLKLIAKAKLMEGADRRLTPLINEAGQLIAILTASATTARRRAESA